MKKLKLSQIFETARQYIFKIVIIFLFLLKFDTLRIIIILSISIFHDRYIND